MQWYAEIEKYQVWVYLGIFACVFVFAFKLAFVFGESAHLSSRNANNSTCSKFQPSNVSKYIPKNHCWET